MEVVPQNTDLNRTCTFFRNRDVYMSFEECALIPGFEKRLAAYVDESARSWWIGHTQFWIATLLMLTWPYRYANSQTLAPALDSIVSLSRSVNENTIYHQLRKNWVKLELRRHIKSAYPHITTFSFLADGFSGTPPARRRTLSARSCSCPDRIQRHLEKTSWRSAQTRQTRCRFQ